MRKKSEKFAPLIAPTPEMAKILGPTVMSPDDPILNDPLLSRPDSVKSGQLISKHLRAELLSDEGAKAQLLAKAIIDQACKGNAAAIKTIFDRIEGPLEIEGAGGKVEFLVRFES